MKKNPYREAIPDFPGMIDDLMVLGLSQSEIARRIGCAQAAISRIQRGDRLDPQASVAFPLQALHKHEMAKATRRARRKVA